MALDRGCRLGGNVMAEEQAAGVGSWGDKPMQVGVHLAVGGKGVPDKKGMGGGGSWGGMGCCRLSCICVCMQSPSRVNSLCWEYSQGM